MRKIVQCLQSSNVNVTVYDTVKAIKKAGFDGAFAQWYKRGAGGVTVGGREQVGLIRDEGLFVPFVHLGYDHINDLWLDGKPGDDMIDDYIADLDEVEKVGVDTVILHLTSKQNPPAPNELGVNRIMRLFLAAEERGISVALENNKVPGYFEYVFRMTGDSAKVCLDVGHWHAHFKDRFDRKLLDGRIVAVHLHDNFGEDDEHLLPFDGNVPWEFYAENISACGYGGDITLESRYYGKYTVESLDEFYRTAFSKACKLREIFDKY